jgi:hypothetical protein
MNEPYDETLARLETSILWFRDMAIAARSFRDAAEAEGDSEISEPAERAFGGLSDMVSCLQDRRSAILEADGAEVIPVIKGDRPILTLIKGGRWNDKLSQG